MSKVVVDAVALADLLANASGNTRFIQFVKRVQSSVRKYEAAKEVGGAVVSGGVQVAQEAIESKKEIVDAVDEVRDTAVNAYTNVRNRATRLKNDES